MNIFKFFKKHRVTIIITFVTGLILIYIKPLLDFLGGKLISFLLLISDKYNEFYYTLIAKNDPYLIVSDTNYMIIFVAFSVYVGIFIYLLDQRKGLKKDASENLVKIKNIKKRITDNNVEQDNDLGEESILSELDKIEVIAEDNVRYFEKPNRVVLTARIVIVLVGILLFSKFAFYQSISDKNVEFRNRTRIILPYIGQEKINRLNSKWAQMKNSEDYEKIINELDEHEGQHIK